MHCFDLSENLLVLCIIVSQQYGSERERKKRERERDAHILLGLQWDHHDHHHL